MTQWNEAREKIAQLFLEHKRGNLHLRDAVEAVLSPHIDAKNDFEIVWLREVDAGTDNACWIPSNRVDPSAVAFVPLHSKSDCTGLVGGQRNV
jgi:hypothetical protein